jgi:OOP family OmpA-OmpF porin
MESVFSNLLNQVTTGNNLSTIAKSVGGDEKGVQSTLNMGLPLLLHSMANNASTSSGADKLTKMLTQTGTNNPLDNLGSFLSNPAASGGSSMVNALLGSQTSAIHNSISQKTGLSSEVVGKVLAIAAPMVMGHVSKMVAGKNLDQKGLSSLLGEHSKTVMQSSPEAASIAKQFLGTKEKGILQRVFGG